MFWINLYDTGTLEHIRDVEIRTEMIQQHGTPSEVYAIKHGKSKRSFTKTALVGPRKTLFYYI